MATGDYNYWLSKANTDHADWSDDAKKRRAQSQAQVSTDMVNTYNNVDPNEGKMSYRQRAAALGDTAYDIGANTFKEGSLLDTISTVGGSIVGGAVEATFETPTFLWDVASMPFSDKSGWNFGKTKERANQLQDQGLNRAASWLTAVDEGNREGGNVFAESAFQLLNNPIALKGVGKGLSIGADLFSKGTKSILKTGKVANIADDVAKAGTSLAETEKGVSGAIKVADGVSEGAAKTATKTASNVAKETAEQTVKNGTKGASVLDKLKSGVGKFGEKVVESIRGGVGDIGVIATKAVKGFKAGTKIGGVGKGIAAGLTETMSATLDIASKFVSNPLSYRVPRVWQSQILDTALGDTAEAGISNIEKANFRDEYGYSLDSVLYAQSNEELEKFYNANNIPADKRLSLDEIREAYEGVSHNFIGDFTEFNKNLYEVSDIFSADQIMFESRKGTISTEAGLRGRVQQTEPVVLSSGISVNLETGEATDKNGNEISLDDLSDQDVSELREAVINNQSQNNGQTQLGSGGKELSMLDTLNSWTNNGFLTQTTLKNIQTGVNTYKDSIYISNQLNEASKDFASAIVGLYGNDSLEKDVNLQREVYNNLLSYQKLFDGVVNAINEVDEKKYNGTYQFREAMTAAYNNLSAEDKKNIDSNIYRRAIDYNNNKESWFDSKYMGLATAVKEFTADTVGFMFTDENEQKWDKMGFTGLGDSRVNPDTIGWSSVFESSMSALKQNAPYLIDVAILNKINNKFIEPAVEKQLNKIIIANPVLNSYRSVGFMKGAITEMASEPLENFTDAISMVDSSDTNYDYWQGLLFGMFQGGLAGYASSSANYTSVKEYFQNPDNQTEILNRMGIDIEAIDDPQKKAMAYSVIQQCFENVVDIMMNTAEKSNYGVESVAQGFAITMTNRMAAEYTTDILNQFKVAIEGIDGGRNYENRTEDEINSVFASDVEFKKFLNGEVFKLSDSFKDSIINSEQNKKNLATISQKATSLIIAAQSVRGKSFKEMLNILAPKVDKYGNKIITNVVDDKDILTAMVAAMNGNSMHDNIIGFLSTGANIPTIGEILGISPDDPVVWDSNKGEFRTEIEIDDPANEGQKKKISMREYVINRFLESDIRPDIKQFLYDMLFNTSVSGINHYFKDNGSLTRLGKDFFSQVLPLILLQESAANKNFLEFLAKSEINKQVKVEVSKQKARAKVGGNTTKEKTVNVKGGGYVTRGTNLNNVDNDIEINAKNEQGTNITIGDLIKNKQTRIQNSDGSVTQITVDDEGVLVGIDNSKEQTDEGTTAVEVSEGEVISNTESGNLVGSTDVELSESEKQEYEIVPDEGMLFDGMNLVQAYNKLKSKLPVKKADQGKDKTTHGPVINYQAMENFRPLDGWKWNESDEIINENIENSQRARITKANGEVEEYYVVWQTDLTDITRDRKTHDNFKSFLLVKPGETVRKYKSTVYRGPGLNTQGKPLTYDGNNYVLDIIGEDGQIVKENRAVCFTKGYENDKNGVGHPIWRLTTTVQLDRLGEENRENAWRKGNVFLVSNMTDANQWQTNYVDENNNIINFDSRPIYTFSDIIINENNAKIEIAGETLDISKISQKAANVDRKKLTPEVEETYNILWKKTQRVRSDGTVVETDIDEAEEKLSNAEEDYEEIESNPESTEEQKQEAKEKVEEAKAKVEEEKTKLEGATKVDISDNKQQAHALINKIQKSIDEDYNKGVEESDNKTTDPTVSETESSVEVSMEKDPARFIISGDAEQQFIYDGDIKSLFISNVLEEFGEDIDEERIYQMLSEYNDINDMKKGTEEHEDAIDDFNDKWGSTALNTLEYLGRITLNRANVLKSFANKNRLFSESELLNNDIVSAEEQEKQIIKKAKKIVGKSPNRITEEDKQFLKDNGFELYDDFDGRAFNGYNDRGSNLVDIIANDSTYSSGTKLKIFRYGLIKNKSIIERGKATIADMNIEELDLYEQELSSKIKILRYNGFNEEADIAEQEKQEILKDMDKAMGVDNEQTETTEQPVTTEQPNTQESLENQLASIAKQSKQTTVQSTQDKVKQSELIVYNKVGDRAKEIYEKGNIPAYRKSVDGNKEHTFGNPFVRGKDGTVKEVTEKFRQRLNGEAYKNMFQERREFMITQINRMIASGNIPKVIYYTEDIPNSDKSYGEGVTKYDAEHPSHANVLLDYINNIIENYYFDIPSQPKQQESLENKLASIAKQSKQSQVEDQILEDIKDEQLPYVTDITQNLNQIIASKFVLSQDKINQLVSDCNEMDISLKLLNEEDLSTIIYAYSKGNGINDVIEMFAQNIAAYKIDRKLADILIKKGVLRKEATYEGYTVDQAIAISVTRGYMIHQSLDAIINNEELKERATNKGYTIDQENYADIANEYIKQQKLDDVIDIEGLNDTLGIKRITAIDALVNYYIQNFFNLNPQTVKEEFRKAIKEKVYNMLKDNNIVFEKDAVEGEQTEDADNTIALRLQEIDADERAAYVEEFYRHGLITTTQYNILMKNNPTLTFMGKNNEDVVGLLSESIIKIMNEKFGGFYVNNRAKLVLFNDIYTYFANNPKATYPGLIKYLNSKEYKGNIVRMIEVLERDCEKIYNGKHDSFEMSQLSVDDFNRDSHYRIGGAYDKFVAGLGEGDSIKIETLLALYYLDNGEYRDAFFTIINEAPDSIRSEIKRIFIEDNNRGGSEHLALGLVSTFLEYPESAMKSVIEDFSNKKLKEVVEPAYKDIISYKLKNFDRFYICNPESTQMLIDSFGIKGLDPTIGTVILNQNNEDLYPWDNLEDIESFPLLNVNVNELKDFKLNVNIIVPYGTTLKKDTDVSGVNVVNVKNMGIVNGNLVKKKAGAENSLLRNQLISINGLSGNNIDLVEGYELSESDKKLIDSLKENKSLYEQIIENWIYPNFKLTEDEKTLLIGAITEEGMKKVDSEILYHCFQCNSITEGVIAAAIVCNTLTEGKETFKLDINGKRMFNENKANKLFKSEILDKFTKQGKQDRNIKAIKDKLKAMFVSYVTLQERIQLGNIEDVQAAINTFRSEHNEAIKELDEFFNREGRVDRGYSLGEIFYQGTTVKTESLERDEETGDFISTAEFEKDIKIREDNLQGLKNNLNKLEARQKNGEEVSDVAIRKLKDDIKKAEKRLESAKKNPAKALKKLNKSISSEKTINKRSKNSVVASYEDRGSNLEMEGSEAGNMAFLDKTEHVLGILNEMILDGVSSVYKTELPLITQDSAIINTSLMGTIHGTDSFVKTNILKKGKPSNQKLDVIKPDDLYRVQGILCSLNKEDRDSLIDEMFEVKMVGNNMFTNYTDVLKEVRDSIKQNPRSYAYQVGKLLFSDGVDRYNSSEHTLISSTEFRKINKNGLISSINKAWANRWKPLSSEELKQAHEKYGKYFTNSNGKQIKATDGQMQGFVWLLDRYNDRFNSKSSTPLYIPGRAGTGKTTMVVAFLKYLDSINEVGNEIDMIKSGKQTQIFMDPGIKYNKSGDAYIKYFDKNNGNTVYLKVNQSNVKTQPELKEQYEGMNDSEKASFLEGINKGLGGGWSNEAMITYLKFNSKESNAKYKVLISNFEIISEADYNKVPKEDRCSGHLLYASGGTIWNESNKSEKYYRTNNIFNNITFATRTHSTETSLRRIIPEDINSDGIVFQTIDKFFQQTTNIDLTGFSEGLIVKDEYKNMSGKVIIIDEAQNAYGEKFRALIEQIGDKNQIIFLGDPSQMSKSGFFKQETELSEVKLTETKRAGKNINNMVTLNSELQDVIVDANAVGIVITGEEIKGYEDGTIPDIKESHDKETLYVTTENKRRNEINRKYLEKKRKEGKNAEIQVTVINVDVPKDANKINKDALSKAVVTDGIYKNRDFVVGNLFKLKMNVFQKNDKIGYPCYEDKKSNTLIVYISETNTATKEFKGRKELLNKIRESHYGNVIVTTTAYAITTENESGKTVDNIILDSSIVNPKYDFLGEQNAQQYYDAFSRGRTIYMPKLDNNRLIYITPEQADKMIAGEGMSEFKTKESSKTTEELRVKFLKFSNMLDRKHGGINKTMQLNAIKQCYETMLSSDLLKNVKNEDDKKKIKSNAMRGLDYINLLLNGNLESEDYTGLRDKQSRFNQVEYELGITWNNIRPIVFKYNLELEPSAVDGIDSYTYGYKITAPVVKENGKYLSSSQINKKLRDTIYATATQANKPFSYDSLKDIIKTNEQTGYGASTQYIGQYDMKEYIDSKGNKRIKLVKVAVEYETKNVGGVLSKGFDKKTEAQKKAMNDDIELLNIINSKELDELSKYDKLVKAFIKSRGEEGTVSDRIDEFVASGTDRNGVEYSGFRKDIAGSTSTETEYMTPYIVKVGDALLELGTLEPEEIRKIYPDIETLYEEMKFFNDEIADIKDGLSIWESDKNDPDFDGMLGSIQESFSCGN